MKYFLVVLILVSTLFAWPKKIDQTRYCNIKCDVYIDYDLGYKMTYLIQAEKPYAILHMKIKCPNGNVWRLKNVEILK